MDVVRIFCLMILYVLSFVPAVFANGSIEGIVSYNGPLPHARVVHMDADPICYAVNKGNTHSQAIIVGDNNSLADAFVYIKGGLAKTDYPPPAQEAVITQAGCNYAPHVNGVVAGQRVKFINPDGTLHNVHVISRINPEFNASMPDFRKEMEVVFSKPEFMFQIRCDVHPWMQAWMAVMSHPFFAVTGKDGKFEIQNVPAGTYQIAAWHDKLQDQAATVTVTDNSTQKVDFTFSTSK